MDDVNVRGTPTWYEPNSAGWYILTAFADLPPQSTPVPCTPAPDHPHLSLDDQHFKVIPENTGICQFIWEHLNDINHVLQHVKKAGGTFPGWEMDVCIREVVAVCHHCTYEGCYPEDWKVQNIFDWPDCNTLTEVCGFLGVYGVIQIWVKDFTKHAKPLVVLTKKDINFVWGPEQKASMEDLKQVIITAPCLQPIDYHSNRCVILAVNSSCISTGFILLQLGADNKFYPSQFGSITWNKRESHYSQAKIEIYGLWQPSKHIGSTSLVWVEIDTSYIKAMLNIQPGATVNRWIVSIKLFQFELQCKTNNVNTYRVASKSSKLGF